MRRIVSIVVAWVLLVAIVIPCQAQSGQSSQPRLVLLLVIDQFAYDYLSRYQERFGSNGFRFLSDHGASFLACRYQDATTQTAVGHSVIATGAYPWSTGIIANSWWDRRNQKDTTAVTDETVQLVGGNGPGASSKAMHGTTIGDVLKLVTNGRSRVITVSLKERSAVLLAGRMANWAFWWDDRTGNFVSSSQFASSLPAWATAFNDSHYADRYFGKPWQRMLPETLYNASTRDDCPWELPLPGDGRCFPHVITGGVSAPSEPFYSTFVMTPWANQMVSDFALECITNEKLGQHNDPDLLAISFTASDYLGHSFGPNSQEIEDLFIRLDQTLAGLFKGVDQKVGLDHCLIVLTGDHGVSAIPELLKEHGVDAGRIDPKTFALVLNQSLSGRLGNDEWISAFVPPNLYLNLAAIDKQKYRQPDVEALAAKLARSIQGIGEVYTAAQLFTNQLPAGPQAPAVKRSYYWGRSGELYLLPLPGYIFSGNSGGTTHGSPYTYDSQVPLIMYGAGIHPGRYGGASSPADIAPTISAVLGMAPPSLSEGRVLTEALTGRSPSVTVTPQDAGAQ